MKRYIEVRAENHEGELLQLGVRLVEREENYGYRNRIIHDEIDPMLQFRVDEEIVGDMKLSHLLKSFPGTTIDLLDVTLPKQSINEIVQTYQDYFLQLELPEVMLDLSSQLQKWEELADFSVVFEDGRIWSLEDTVKAEIIKDIALLQVNPSEENQATLTSVFGAARFQRIYEIKDKAAYGEKLNDFHLEGSFIYGDQIRDYLQAMKEDGIAHDIVAASAYQLRPLRGRLLNQILNKDAITLEIRSFPLGEVIDEREVAQLVIRDNQNEVVYSLWGNEPLDGELEPYAIYAANGDYLLEDFVQITPEIQQLVKNYVQDSQYAFSTIINDVALDKEVMLKEILQAEKHLQKGKSLPTGDLPFDFS